MPPRPLPPPPTEVDAWTGAEQRVTDASLVLADSAARRRRASVYDANGVLLGYADADADAPPPPSPPPAQTTPEQRLRLELSASSRISQQENFTIPAISDALGGLRNASNAAAGEWCRGGAGRAAKRAFPA